MRTCSVRYLVLNKLYLSGFSEPDTPLFDVQLLDAPESKKLFPADVLKRAKEYLDATGSGGTGAYTHSQGVELCRQHVAMVCCLLQLDPIHALI